MRFAVALPWWGYVLAFGVAGALAWAAYARVAVTLGRGTHAVLVLLRATTLGLIVAALLRPIAVVPTANPEVRALPILVDVSRSMRMSDDGRATRLEEARRLGDRIAARWVTAIGWNGWPSASR